MGLEVLALLASACAVVHGLYLDYDLQPLHGVEVASMFSAGSDEVAAGQPVEMLVGIHNGANVPLTVDAIQGLVNSPLNTFLNVQNLTVSTYKHVVPGQKEVTIKYSFTTDESLVGKEFNLMQTIFYSNGPHRFSQTFFNSTVLMVEPEDTFDSNTVLLYIQLLMFISGLGYYGFKWAEKKGYLKDYIKTQQVKPNFYENTDAWLPGSVLKSTKPKIK